MKRNQSKFERQGSRRSRGMTNRRGTTTVEFALVLPIALFITFGLVEFSRVNIIRNTAQNAAYEGARTAIIPGGTAQNAQTRAAAILGIIGVDNATIIVDPPVVTNSSPSVTVTISVPLGQNMWVTPRYFVNQQMVKSCKLTRESTQSGF